MNAIEEEVMVAMPDGVRLRTKIARADDTPRPVVLIRGYNTDFWGGVSDRFVDAGYVYVGQATRGHIGSEGAHAMDNRFFDDAQDGYDAITWTAEQEWCNGDVAMYGSSYYGATQWLVAPLQHPNLKAIVPQNINPDPWERQYRDHGALQLAHTARRIYDYNEKGKELVERFGLLNWYKHLPLRDLDTVADTPPNRLYQDYLNHAEYDDFWRAIGTRDHYSEVRIPVYMMSGWYDNYPGATLTYFNRMKEVGATDEIRVAIFPTTHSGFAVVGDRDFGEDADQDQIALAIRWLDAVLKGHDDGIGAEPPVRIFTMGVNEWRLEDQWPPARTSAVPYYLHVGTGPHDGGLSPDPPEDDTTLEYVYNPEDPVPTRGGNHSSPLIEGVIRAGPVDQRPNEDRPDVLVFTSEPVDEPVEVTGPVTATIYAASSARDTDWVVRLIDVYPDGTAFNLTEGILRGRFRESIWEPERLMEPGQVYAFEIDLMATSNVFLPGHRIRVHVTSSNFPLWDRNPNTGHEQGSDAELVEAQQTIHCSPDRSSHVMLSVAE